MNVIALRDETPGCRTGAAYFNAAGAALMPSPVVDAVVDYLQLEARIGGYEAAEEQAARLEQLYTAAAVLFHCEPHEIAVVESATRAWDMAFYAIPFASGDRILTAENEYGSNYVAMLQAAARTGAVVEVVPGGEDGTVSIEALRAMMDERVKLIAITHIASNGGMVQPVAEVGAVAAQGNVPFLLDACQSAGQLDVDVRAIGCTMLAATSRKFLRGPRGAGLLYVRSDWIPRLEPPFLDIRAADLAWPGSYNIRQDARRFEAWESSHATRIGLAAAIEYALGITLDAIRARVTSLAETMRESLAAIAGVLVHDRGRERAGIVTFSVDGMDSHGVRHALRQRGVIVSVSGASAAPIDMARRNLDAIVRASPHYYNTEEDVERLAAAVRKLAGRR